MKKLLCILKNFILLSTILFSQEIITHKLLESKVFVNNEYFSQIILRFHDGKYKIRTKYDAQIGKYNILNNNKIKMVPIYDNKEHEDKSYHLVLEKSDNTLYSTLLLRSIDKEYEEIWYSKDDLVKPGLFRYYNNIAVIKTENIRVCTKGNVFFREFPNSESNNYIFVYDNPNDRKELIQTPYIKGEYFDIYIIAKTKERIVINGFIDHWYLVIIKPFYADPMSNREIILSGQKKRNVYAWIFGGDIKFNK